MTSEWRQHPRFAASFPIHLRAQPQECPDIAFLHDISHSGLSFKSRQVQRYTSGDRYLGTVYTPEQSSGHDAQMELVLTVIWVRACGDDSVLVGARLEGLNEIETLRE